MSGNGQVFYHIDMRTRSMKTIYSITLAVVIVSTAYAQPAQLAPLPEPPPPVQCIDTGLSIRATYGFGRLLHKDLIEDYAADNLWEVHLAFRNTQSVTTRDGVTIPGMRLSSFFFSSRSSLADGGGFASSAARFGLRTASGYGWMSEAGMVVPYSSGSMIWTNVDVGTTNVDSRDRSILADYNDARRFGTAIEMGLEVISENGLALGAGIERHLVYPRHLVFTWMLSSGIQSILSETAGTALTRMSGSPVAGPIVAFLISNGIRFGISELQRDEMYWPFTSAPPLVYDAFELSVAYTF